jgi:flagellar basal body-associated protein FliL
MEKVLSILGVATKIMSFLVVTVIAVISLATAYIMFAPDEFPKPFRLVYDYAAPAGTGEEAVHIIEATSTPEPPKPGEGKMFNMSTKIINLADPTGRKYIRLTVVLEFMPEGEETAVAESSAKEGESAAPAAPTFEEIVNARMPIMDDVVIKHLSTKSFEDLYTAEGKEKLRDELMNAIQESVPDFHLISIYFTEFVVQ